MSSTAGKSKESSLIHTINKLPDGSRCLDFVNKGLLSAVVLGITSSVVSTSSVDGGIARGSFGLLI
jgi:hypothetical protein